MLEKVHQDRLSKLQKIRELGIDPYGGRYDSAEPIAGVLGRYRDGDDSQKADVAGRLILLRKMGSLIFAHVRDSSGQMQVGFSKKALDPAAWTLAKQLLDLGDLVGVAGRLGKTQTGEITIWAERLTLLCKSLLPMPEKYHGLADVETRYRQRYLELMSSPEAVAAARTRVAIVEHIRQGLNRRRFVEVETPVLQRIYGGGAARPFTTHHNTLDCDLFMRVSPELYLKRLLVGGMERVYEFSRSFRNEGIDSSHSPEYTLLELYQAYADYEVMMELAEELISSVARDVCGSLELPYEELEIDYRPPFRRVTYDEALREYTGVSLGDPEALREKAQRLGIEPAGKADGVVADELFDQEVQRHLVQPTFVKDYPAELCPLTRRKQGNPSLALRFELFVAGMEIANAYTELNDPAVQEANFREQVAGENRDETMRVMDEDFVRALQHGMPPAGGMGIGLDRLVMLLTNRTSIRDVILFPMLRPQVEP